PDREPRRLGVHPHLAGRGRFDHRALGLPRRRRTPRTGRGLAAVPLVRHTGAAPFRTRTRLHDVMAGRRRSVLSAVPVFNHRDQGTKRSEENEMTATYTFDVFSSLDGYGSASADWTGYWGKQGPQLLDHRLDLFGDEQRM